MTASVAAPQGVSQVRSVGFRRHQRAASFRAHGPCLCRDLRQRSTTPGARGRQPRWIDLALRAAVPVMGSVGSRATLGVAAPRRTFFPGRGTRPRLGTPRHARLRPARPDAADRAGAEETASLPEAARLASTTATRSTCATGPRSMLPPACASAAMSGEPRGRRRRAHPARHEQAAVSGSCRSGSHARASRLDQADPGSSATSGRSALPQVGAGAASTCACARSRTASPDREVADLSPRALRHTATTHLLEGARPAPGPGGPRSLSLATTQRYTHVTAERLRASYTRSPPRA